MNINKGKIKDGQQSKENEIKRSDDLEYQKLEYDKFVKKMKGLKQQEIVYKKYIREAEKYDKLESIDTRVINEKFTQSGERLATIKDIRTFKKNMNEKGIDVVVDEKEKILPRGAAAGFDYDTGKIVIRKNASLVSLYHESFHAQQYLELGKNAYIKIGRLAREEYVYKKIVESKMFNEAELKHSEWYINKLRGELKNE